MISIIPAINARDARTALARINTASKLLPEGGWLHIDIVDGDYAPVKTWGSPVELRILKEKYPVLNFEIHLMVQDPESVLERWLSAGAKRVIVHQEVIKNPKFILGKCAEVGAQAMLSVQRTTPKENILPYIKSFSYFQVLTVTPGFAGQKFGTDALKLVEFLRVRNSNAKIEVDGGIDDKTIKEVISAGADMATSASYIFNSPSPQNAYQSLQQT